VNPTSNNSSLTQANSGSIDTSTTPPAAETKRRKYKKRGSTGFIQHKGTKVSRGSSKATCVAKQCASAAISESTNENEDNTAAVKICQDDKLKLISLFYLQIGAPPPKDWYGKGGMISRTVEALEMTIEEHRKVETVISDTYQSLHQEKVFDEGRISRKNKTAIADGSKIQQLVADYRESGLSFSKTTFLINIYCVEKTYLLLHAQLSCHVNKG
jgi:hypothetical protein